MYRAYTELLNSAAFNSKGNVKRKRLPFSVFILKPPLLLPIY